LKVITYQFQPMITKYTLRFAQLNEQQSLDAIEKMAKDNDLRVEVMDELIHRVHLPFLPDGGYFFIIESEISVSLQKKMTT